MDGVSNFRCVSSHKVLVVGTGFIESNPLPIEPHKSRPSTQLILGKIPCDSKQPLLQPHMRCGKQHAVLKQPSKGLRGDACCQVGFMQDAPYIPVDSIVIPEAQGLESARVCSHQVQQLPISPLLRFLHCASLHPKDRSRLLLYNSY
jgi:hypothetical protein